MLFGMGFFIAIFIAIARCANRTGGPCVPAGACLWKPRKGNYQWQQALISMI